MKIGILGTRGIPNAYGGFEQFAQFLAEGLVLKGYNVSVYNSSAHPYKESKWKDVNIIHCTDYEEKIGTAGQFMYDFNCLRDARKQKYDILLHLGYTSNSVWYWLWPSTAVNIVNMDGLEWKRSKYKPATQKFLKLAEMWAATHADVLVADSIGIQDHLLTEYDKKSVYIPYGASLFTDPDESVLSEWGLEANHYFLLIARMEPENNIEMIIDGFLKSKQSFPLVIVGNHNNKFGIYLKQKYPQPGIRFLGSIFDQPKVNNLRYYSSLYFHGHSVGGTNPSLLEAIACSCKIVAHNNIFNKAILTDSALYFETPEEVCSIMDDPEKIAFLGRGVDKNSEKIKSIYNWPAIIDQYEKVFRESLSEIKK